MTTLLHIHSRESRGKQKVLINVMSISFYELCIKGKAINKNSFSLYSNNYLSSSYSDIWRLTRNQSDPSYSCAQE